MDEYEYAVSINMYPTGEGWMDLEAARELLPKWKETGKERMDIDPDTWKILRRRKVGEIEVFE